MGRAAPGSKNGRTQNIFRRAKYLYLEVGKKVFKRGKGKKSKNFRHLQKEHLGLGKGRQIQDLPRTADTLATPLCGSLSGFRIPDIVSYA